MVGKSGLTCSAILVGSRSDAIEKLCVRRHWVFLLDAVALPWLFLRLTGGYV